MSYSKRFGLRFTIVVAVLFLVGGKSFAQQQSVGGFGEEFVVRDYPADGVALLQNFYFRFTNSDRHIQVIEVQPGSPEANKISLGYFDDTRNDEYFYTIGHFTIPAAGVVTANIVSTFVGGGGSPAFICERRVVSKPGPDFTFILTGFSFRYSGNDHHIERISILEDDRTEDESTVSICFNDDDADDVFIYEVGYAWVPNSLIQNTGEESGEVNDETGGDSRSIPGGTPVIRGFKFSYSTPCEGISISEDHHLKEIGVLTTSTTSGDLEVYYSDRNQDDDFCWEARWATLRPIAIGLGEFFFDFDRGQPPETPPPRLPPFLVIGLAILLIIIIAIFVWRRRRASPPTVSGS